MGFGHAVYRTRDPARRCCGRSPTGLGGDLVEQAIDVEARILATLAAAQAGPPAAEQRRVLRRRRDGVGGPPRALFTPTFAVSRSIAWVTHAVEQAAIGKLIRPSAHYVGPSEVIGVWGGGFLLPTLRRVSGGRRRGARRPGGRRRRWRS